MRTISVVALMLVAAIPAWAADLPDTTAVGALRADAKALKPLVESDAARAFLDATATLPDPGWRTLYYDSSRTHYWSDATVASVDEAARAKLITRRLDDHFYYNTRYGSPLAYARPIDLLARAGMKDWSKARFVDFGYGTIGHLRLLASLGADAVGIEVDPLLPVLYGQPGDQGEIPSHGGKLTLVDGHFPAGDGVAEKVGGGYDLFISKNTLKHGYIHPSRPAEPRMLVHLGVDDTAFVRAVHALLKPRGLAMIYNLSPAPDPPDKPYRPWTDGHDPFPRDVWEKAGFEVIAYDKVDDDAARAMGHALGWDQGGPGAMDLKNDLFAHYTIVRKKAK